MLGGYTAGWRMLDNQPLNRLRSLAFNVPWNAKNVPAEAWNSATNCSKERAAVLCFFAFMIFGF